jgi:hypothetical protein
MSQGNVQSFKKTQVATMVYSHIRLVFNKFNSCYAIKVKLQRDPVFERITGSRAHVFIYNFSAGNMIGHSHLTSGKQKANNGQKLFQLVFVPFTRTQEQYKKLNKPLPANKSFVDQLRLCRDKTGSLSTNDHKAAGNYALIIVPERS